MDILDNYKQQISAAQTEIDKYDKLINTYSMLRLMVVASVAVAVYLAVQFIGFTLFAILFVVLLLCFIWLVSKQSGFQERRAYFIALKTVNENEIASITTGSNIYDNGSAFADEKHYYTSDLDIFGKSSLFQLLNRAATSYGKRILSGWLVAPSDKATILNRQQSLKEIAAKENWKADFQAKLLFANKTNTDQLGNLFNYLNQPIEVPGERILRPYIKVAPYLLLASIIAATFYPIVSLAAIALAVLNLGILTAKRSVILKSGFVADKMGDILSNYSRAFKVIENEQWESPQCKAMAEQLLNGQTSKKIEELGRLINKLGYSLVMVVGFILNVFFLWALKQIIAIEDWKRNNRQNFESAIDIIAEFEALTSVSSLHINYPDWCFPEIADGEAYTLVTKNIAHPLINAGKRIANDYELNNTYKIDIITGSNMAGKSTFLRTIGINTVLALSGAPVCASEMTVSVINIISYMRMKDSLNESTSTFKAELDRLQMLLKAVSGDEKIFFLIDEMLRGTNSVDKYLGSKAVIEQLISKKGVGMVATHDLQIAELKKAYPDYVRNFYFDIQVKDNEMLFDYKIKDGECKTFNASMLLKQIGIDVGTGM